MAPTMSPNQWDENPRLLLRTIFGCGMVRRGITISLYDIVSYVGRMFINLLLAFSGSGRITMLPRFDPDMWIEWPHGVDLKPLGFKNCRYTQVVILLLSGGLSEFFNSSGFDVQTSSGRLSWQNVTHFFGMMWLSTHPMQPYTDGCWLLGERNPVYFTKKSKVCKILN